MYVYKLLASLGIINYLCSARLGFVQYGIDSSAAVVVWWNKVFRFVFDMLRFVQAKINVSKLHALWHDQQHRYTDFDVIFG